jgi:dsDNA-specific endonuclease/ATPase MutS2
MATRRASSGDEVSLFPFLSILACLIGALILMIVVMAITTTERGDGRTKEEIETAQKHKDLQKELAEREELKKKTDDLLTKLEEQVKQQQEQEARLARLRKVLSTSAEVQKQNEQMSQEQLKKLDNLLLEIDGIKKQIAESKLEVEKLLAELKERQIPPDKKPPPVVVQPSGSGDDPTQKLFFIEASGGKLVVTIDGKKVNVAATEETIIGSPELNHFLTEVKRAGNAQLIFLLRTDGNTAYTRAGGWAQSMYGIKLSRLLLPGQGDVDLALFGQRLGVVGPLPADFKPPAAPVPPP